MRFISFTASYARLRPRAGITHIPAMNIFHLVRGQPRRRLDALDSMPDEGFVWLDFSRDEDRGWEAWPRRLLQLEMDPRHVLDSADAAHKSFHDVTPHYDLLVFEECGAQRDALAVATCSISMFMFERMLLTVHSADSSGLAELGRKFDGGITRSPASVRVLAEVILDHVVDHFVAATEHFNGSLDELQQSLLDPKNPFQDWQQLLAGRREARRIEWVCKAQLRALERWHRNSGCEWTNPEETRLHDLSEHIVLARDTSADLERHIEAAVQIYFATTGNRTNEIVRTLTVFSAIFLPLTFLAGVYGMNFREMPELSLSFGYPLLLVVMVLIAVLLLKAFRRRGYF
jgi:magnesium transporter